MCYKGKEMHSLGEVPSIEGGRVYCSIWPREDGVCVVTGAGRWGMRSCW